MPYRKVMYRLYPNATQTERLETMRGLHQRLYNTALEERIRVYQETGRGLSFADQCKVLTQWRRISAGLASLNAQSEQVTLKRLHLAFQAFFRRVKNGDTPGFPRFKSLRRYPGWGYKTHGDGWRLHAGENSVHGKLYLQGVGHIPMRGRARTTGTPVTCEILHKAGKWYASVTLEIETIQRERGTAIGAFDWGLTDFLTLATPMGIETVANPRRLKNQLAELKRLGQEVSRKIRMAQERTGRKKGFPVSVSLRHAISHLARLHAKVARQRQDFLHQTSAALVKRFGALGTESLTVQNMVRSGGVRKKGLNREIYAASPAAFLTMIRTKAEEAGSWYEEAPTREIKPTQRCHGPCGPPSVRRLSVCATGRPSRPRALDLGAAHYLSAPLRDAAAVLRASRALFRRTRGSPTITGRRVDVLAGGLRPPARTYASRGLRALAALSLARSECGCGQLPNEKKKLSDRQHQCPHCGATCGRDENAALVLLRWLDARLSGREPSEVWSGGGFTATTGHSAGNEHETHAIAV